MVAAVKAKKRSGSGIFNTTWEPFIYLAPFLIGIIIFTLYPFFNIILISFKEGYRQMTGAFESYGLDNYIHILTDPYFINAIKNTAVYVVFVVPISTALSLFFANLLNQKIKGISLFQTAFFLPMVTSVTAIGLVWKLMFNDRIGVINAILGLFGVDPIGWLLDPSMNIWALIIYGIWNMMPFTIIILLSGLQNIDPLYYTAAKVDGASSRKQFFRITVPLLAPTIGLTCIINVISASKVFGELFPLFSGRPGTAYNLFTVVYYIYYEFNVSYHLGYAAAASVVLFLIVFAFTMLQLYVQRKWQYY